MLKKCTTALFLLLLLFSTTVRSQNHFPATGSVGIGTVTPNANLQIITGSSQANPLLRLDYGWDKTDIFLINRGASKMVTIGNGGGTYSHGVMELYHHLQTDPVIKLSASPLIDSYINSGNVGIGTTATNGYKLAVNGSLFATSVKVRTNLWADFVFDPGYKLPPLSEVADYIKTHRHLPGIPSEKEIKEKDTDLAQINALLLQKIEELTLYMIDMEKEVKTLKEKINQQQNK